MKKNLKCLTALCMAGAMISLTGCGSSSQSTSADTTAGSASSEATTSAESTASGKSIGYVNRIFLYFCLFEK